MCCAPVCSDGLVLRSALLVRGCGPVAWWLQVGGVRGVAVGLQPVWIRGMAVWFLFLFLCILGVGFGPIGVIGLSQYVLWACPNGCIIGWFFANLDFGYRILESLLR